MAPKGFQRRPTRSGSGLLEKGIMAARFAAGDQVEDQEMTALFLTRSQGYAHLVALSLPKANAARLTPQDPGRSSAVRLPDKP